jgi:hypothetical protein
MAKVDSEYAWALEILGLRNSIKRRQKNYPRELCKHLDCLREGY